MMHREVVAAAAVAALISINIPLFGEETLTPVPVPQKKKKVDIGGSDKFQFYVPGNKERADSLGLDLSKAPGKVVIKNKTGTLIRIDIAHCVSASGLVWGLNAFWQISPDEELLLMYNDKPFDPRDFKFTITTPDGEGAVDSWRITAAVDEKGERRVNIVEDDLKITRDEAVKSGKGAAEVITPDGAEVSIGSWKAHVHNRMILLNADDIKSGGNTVKVHVDCDVSGRKVSEEKELTLKAGVSNIWETSAAHQLRQQKAIIDAQQNIAHLENDINTCDIKIKQYENDLKANPYHLGDEHVLNSINGIIGGIELAALLDTQKRRETDRVSLDSERSRLARLQSGE